jgi:hypothetical protein
MAFDSRAVAVYQIRLQHRTEEMREVIGEDYQGILGPDCGKSYDAKELHSGKQLKTNPYHSARRPSERSVWPLINYGFTDELSAFGLLAGIYDAIIVLVP